MILAELGDVADFINGAAFKPDDWHEDGQRIIRIQNLNDPSKPYNRTTKSVPEKYQVPPGTLLVSWSASLGVFEWHESDTALLNQHIFKVVPQEDKVDQGYLKHILEGALVDMEKYHRGSTMKHVNRGEFLGTKIPLPPIDEQKRIAAILDQADALRRLRRCALDRLNTLGQAIFHEMFSSEQNPVVKRLSDIAELINGDRSSNYPSGDDIKEYGILFLSTKNINDWRLALNKCQFITAEKFQSLSRGKLQRGDIVITLRGTLGQAAIFDCEYDTGFINAQMMIIRPRKGIQSDYLLDFIGLDSTQHSLMRGQSGSAVKQLTAKQIGELEVVIPSEEQQTEYRERMRSIRNLRASAEADSRSFEALFSSLQDRAFRGEL